MRLRWDRWIGENGGFVGESGFGVPGPESERSPHPFLRSEDGDRETTNTINSIIRAPMLALRRAGRSRDPAWRQCSEASGLPRATWVAAGGGKYTLSDNCGCHSRSKRAQYDHRNAQNDHIGIGEATVNLASHLLRYDMIRMIRLQAVAADREAAGRLGVDLLVAADAVAAARACKARVAELWS